MKAVILLSGGLNSLVALQWAINEFGGTNDICAVSFDFNNENDKNNTNDIQRAMDICDNYHVASCMPSGIMTNSAPARVRISPPALPCRTLVPSVSREWKSTSMPLP